MDFSKIIEEKIKKNFNPEKIEVIDNSELHRNHKSFNPEKLHLKLIIHSKKFKGMKSVNAHKMIFSLLEEEMKNKIHALEIYIK